MAPCGVAGVFWDVAAFALHIGTLAALQRTDFNFQAAVIVSKARFLVLMGGASSKSKTGL